MARARESRETEAQELTQVNGQPAKRSTARVRNEARQRRLRSELQAVDVVERLKEAANEQEAEIVDVEARAGQWAARANFAFLQCRQFQHLWSQGTDHIFKLDRWHIGRSLECGRCGMVRVDVYKRGEYGTQYRRYIPPEGYSLPTVKDAESNAIPRFIVQQSIIDRSEVLAPPEHVREIYDAFRRHQ
jgi:hypothetical protein